MESVDLLRRAWTLGVVAEVSLEESCEGGKGPTPDGDA